jgi:hypothetical protein
VAATDMGAALTARQRQQQIQLRIVTMGDLLKLWQAFDPKDISKSWSVLEPALVALIQARRPISTRLADRYLTEFRRAEQIAGSATSVLADPLTADDIIPNLRLLGPANARRLDALGRRNVSTITLSNIEGEVTRQILNGGRDSIVATAANDRRCRGYTRVTDGSPCSFCAMLAGRGPVYKDAQSAVNGDVFSERVGGFRAHRKCGCTGEPVYFTDSPWPPSAKKWDSLYSETAKAVPRDTPDWSAEVRREFRRRYEAMSAT